MKSVIENHGSRRRDAPKRARARDQKQLLLAALRLWELKQKKGR